MKFVLLLIFLFLFINPASAAVECVRDKDFSYSYEGYKTFGKINLHNFYNNGECSLIFSLERDTEGGGVREVFSLSDHGKIGATHLTGKRFPTSTNSRSTGARVFYITPRKKTNVSYDYDKDKKTLTIHMTNGEDFVLSSESGEILHIGGVKWKRDPKALRSFIKNGNVIGQYAHSSACINCGNIHPSLRDSEEKFTAASLIIEGLQSGVLLDSNFKRGEDPRGYMHKKTTFTDRNGQKCAITNKYVYKYQLDRNGRLNSMKLKFENDYDKYPTRKGMTETLGEFLKRVCKNNGVPNFEVGTSTNEDCVHCDKKQILPANKALDNLTPVIEKIK